MSSSAPVLSRMYQVTMPDQSVWEVPVIRIAEHRSKLLADSEDPEVIHQFMMEDTVPLFEEDDYEIEDWAANNMNWSDVSDVAKMVTKGDVDYQEGWMNGEKRIV